MRLIQGKRSRARRKGVAAAKPTPGAATAPDDDGLSGAQRDAIAALLKELGVGDAIERRLFLAALDYQVSAFSRRVGALDNRANAALLKQACLEAAVQLHDTAPDIGHADVQRLCVSFVSEIARSYDACFETPPTADRQGPFKRVLANLCDATGLPPLHCSADVIQRAIGAGGTRPA
jgi:hypothetical protein